MEHWNVKKEGRLELRLQQFQNSLVRERNSWNG